ncbi:MAG: DUF4145 domain-containing protein [Acidobacteria bacterium]|nr:DUF4145 domain-containing protein [Acidobacteriota bacterium]
MTREELLRKMRKAEEVKRTLIQDRSQGESEFDTLLREDTTDGMVYFKRGEAYEVIGDLELAERDLRTALPLIRPGKLDWKQRVQEALERVQEAQKAQGIERILGNIPATLKKMIEATLNETEEPLKNMLGCFAALEGIVGHLASLGKLRFPAMCNPAEKIKTLREAGLIGDITASHMHTIRVLRNGAAHGKSSVLAEDAKVSRTALRAVVTRVYSNSS